MESKNWNAAMERWLANEKKKQDRMVEETIREYKLNEAQQKLQEKEVAAND